MGGLGEFGGFRSRDASSDGSGRPHAAVAATQVRVERPAETPPQADGCRPQYFTFRDRRQVHAEVAAGQRGRSLRRRRELVGRARARLMHTSDFASAAPRRRHRPADHAALIFSGRPRTSLVVSASALGLLGSIGLRSRRYRRAAETLPEGRSRTPVSSWFRPSRVAAFSVTRPASGTAVVGRPLAAGRWRLPARKQDGIRS